MVKLNPKLFPRINAVDPDGGGRDPGLHERFLQHGAPAQRKIGGGRGGRAKVGFHGGAWLVILAGRDLGHALERAVGRLR